MNNNLRNTSFTNSNEGAVSYDLMPSYSMQGIEFIYSNVFQNKHQIIADIGSGTGRLTAQLIQNNEIYAVEPDTKMSAVAETKFYTFCLSLWIFPFSNGEDVQRIIHSKDFDLPKFKCLIKKIFDKYSTNNLIVLPLSTEVHFPY